MNPNNLLAILALGTVLTMASVAVAPGIAYGQLIDADVANVDCDQDQESKQNTEQGQVVDQDNKQSSEEILLSEQKNDQNTEQDSEQNSLLGSIEALLSGNQDSEDSAENENEQETDQSAENENEQESEQSNEASQDCSAVDIL